MGKKRERVVKLLTTNVYKSAKPTSRLTDEEDEICECTLAGCCDDESGCLNRLCFVECTGACPCGEACENQRLQRGIGAAVEVRETPNRGKGLFATQPIKKGSLVAEYVGEVLSSREAAARAAANPGRETFYLMALTADLTIDATHYGGVARYANHSCEPNCVTEKWAVGAERRVGLFAARPINAAEELTYNYDAEFGGGAVPTACLCGAPSCRGVLGSRAPLRRGASPTSTPPRPHRVTWVRDDDSGEMFAVDGSVDMAAYDSGGEGAPPSAPGVGTVTTPTPGHGGGVPRAPPNSSLSAALLDMALAPWLTETAMARMSQAANGHAALLTMLGARGAAQAPCLHGRSGR